MDLTVPSSGVNGAGTDPTGFNWWDGGQGCIGLECFGGGFLGGMPFDPGHSMFGGAVAGPAGAGAGAGTSTPKHPGGGPVSTSEDFRAASLPVGPSAPTVSVMGPPSSGARAAFGPGFAPLLGSDWVVWSGPLASEQFLGGAALGMAEFLFSFVNPSSPSFGMDLKAVTSMGYTFDDFLRHLPLGNHVA